MAVRESLYNGNGGNKKGFHCESLFLLLRLEVWLSQSYRSIKWQIRLTKGKVLKYYVIALKRQVLKYLNIAVQLQGLALI